MLYHVSAKHHRIFFLSLFHIQVLNEGSLTGWQQCGDFGGPVLLLAAEGASDIGVDTYLPQTGCIRNRYTATDAGLLETKEIVNISQDPNFLKRF